MTVDSMMLPPESAPPQGVEGVVPDRPALASDIELIGEVQGSGYTDSQWLIKRRGHFVQLSEPLYRVAERADGRRTSAEIAAGITEATDWALTAENVRQIVQAKLIPLGLIAPAGGQQIAPGTGPGRRTDSSTSSMLRTRVLGPRAVDAVARVVQVLFAPPLLVLTLTLILAAHFWLYFVGGSAVHEAFRAPRFVEAVALVLGTAMFHEFGHAAALRYGGGRARGIGLGLYFVYPVFYTDTTESYRLGRGARVRTGLGGVYFSLIAAAALIALYAAVGWEFLLLAVVLINVEVLYQFMPFGRLDGYWVLTDLTGVPDFYSEAVAYLRGVLSRRRGGAGGRSARLKQWVRVVFGVYVAVGLPLLALLMGMLLARLPLLAMASWEAIQLQGQAVRESMPLRDGRVILGQLGQLLMLVMQLLLMVLVLGMNARRAAGALWRWSRPTPGRRAAGASVAMGGLCLLFLVWRV